MDSAPSHAVQVAAAALGELSQGLANDHSALLGITDSDMDSVDFLAHVCNSTLMRKQAEINGIANRYHSAALSP
jgi:hypothetical protein